MLSRVAGLFIISSLIFTLGACSSARKAREAEREKVITNTGFICDFINGDTYTDVEVQLNLEMAKRCDSNKNFSISGYKNSAEVTGIVYCCSLTKKSSEPKAKESKSEKSDVNESKLSPETKPEVKTPETKTEEKKPAAGGKKSPASADEEDVLE